jgi:4-amino-4-deoxy-L-arabinose transferase-like glycosyltransferase
VAAILHVVVVTSIFLIGHYRLLPGTFDENGIGISFAVDGVAYTRLVSDMTSVLKNNGLSAWLSLQAPLHCRLYSLAFALSGNILGYNILAAEPLNLLYYLGIVTLVFWLGSELFDQRTGLIAAVVIGAWPSFLVHSTQLIRDPLSILLLLALVFVMTLLLLRTLSWQRALWISITSSIVIATFWLTRGNMWNVILIALGITATLLVIRMLRERRLLLANALLLVVLSFTALVVPSRLPSVRFSGTRVVDPVIAIGFDSTQSGGWWSKLVNEVRRRRSAFSIYAAQKSNIDSDVRLNSTTDIISYLPRAIVIGCLAPFPRMWFEDGTSSRAGRMLAGAETLFMYLFYVSTLLCVWNNRRNLAVWLLFLIAFVGMMSLGLVVVNVGAMFRFRYVFWMLVIVLGVGFTLNYRDLTVKYKRSGRGQAQRAPAG